MIHEFYEKLAKIAVNYSLGVKKGDRIIISGPALAKELFQAMFREVIIAGGHPYLTPTIEGTQEIMYKYASEEQLTYMHNFLKIAFKECDGYVEVFGDYNTRKLSLVDPKKISIARGSPARRELLQTLMERVTKKELAYLVMPYPCNSFAQEANMDLFSYFEFVQKALFLDKEDPVKEWLDLEKNQERICDYLNNVDDVHLISEDSNLSMSVKGRKWINDCGHLNLPDGEICTSPLENSVNGHIRFTYPGIFQGNEIENVYLEFKEGKVIKATADKGENLLKEILEVENANILGEFAIGSNYGIKYFTKNILFDEKIGGTIHCALGLGIPETGSKNISAIHWDILKDMKSPDSKIVADGKTIYEEGKWKV